MKYIDHSEENDRPRLIMEFLPLGNLAKQRAARAFSALEVGKVFEDILKGLAFLHHRGMIHR